MRSTGLAVLIFVASCVRPVFGADLLTDEQLVEMSRLGRHFADMAESGPDTPESAAEALAVARDDHQVPGVRWQALVAYARVSRRLKRSREAVANVWALRGKIGEAFDAADEALIAIGGPALSYFGPELRACGFIAAGATMLIIEQNPGTAEAAAAAPDVVRGIACSDERVGAACVRALATLGHLERPQIAELEGMLRSAQSALARARAASVLGAVSADAPRSIKSLERALTDRSELVRLSAASALVRLKRPGRARPVLVRLGRSSDPGTAAAAARALKE